MGGRKSPNDSGKGGHRDQAEKKIRGFGRGHGAHHRHKPGRDAPRPIATGRDRTQEGTRDRQLLRMSDDTLSDLEKMGKAASVERRLSDSNTAESFGAKMEGMLARGRVLEVRKGNFLTQMLSAPEIPAPMGEGEGDSSAGSVFWKTGDILRTYVRGTMQQFDLGLSSLVAPGDEIELIVPPLARRKELFQHEQHGVLTRVQPRRNEFRRLHPSGRSIQTLAANVDRVYIVASAAEPDFRPGFVDRVLVCASASGLPVSLVVNKMDLGLKDSDQKLLDVYNGLGVPVYKVSVGEAGAPTGDFEILKEALAGFRNLLTGHSGVGKSTLLRSLDRALSEAIIRTGDVSTQTGKGTHTTTHGRLFYADLGGGRHAEIIDTPGVREFTPADTDRRNLWGWFPEIAKLQGQCSFSDCSHTREKGCAVLAAVEAGEIHPRRHHSYVRIYETLPM